MKPPKDHLKLPSRLIDELGGYDAIRHRKPVRNVDRKDRRKVERAQKKESRTKLPHSRKSKLCNTEDSESVSRTGAKASIFTTVNGEVGVHREARKRNHTTILKTSQQASNLISATGTIRSPSPPPKKVSRAVLDKLAEDDEEIAALEKKLGIKSTKTLPRAFRDDGLDELLGGIDDLVASGEDELSDKRKRRSEGDEWLDMKRKKARRDKEQDNNEFEDNDFGRNDAESADFDSYSDELNLSNGDEDDSSTEGSSMDANIDNDATDNIIHSGFDAPENARSSKKVRENPYLPPPLPGTITLPKYFPPSLREPSAADSERHSRLRRQIQGLVNRLTEANLISILDNIEKLYRENARQHVTSTVVDVLLTSVCEPSALPDTLIILPAGFIAAVYKVVGADFGTHVIQQIVERFDEHYSNIMKVGNTERSSAMLESKETLNLITLVSELYNFQVIGSILMFDFIRMFLGTFSELNTELLLKMIRTSGPQLRQNDPSSLKDIVTMLRPAVESTDEASISVRTKFMIESINDLKNNKVKTGAAASAVVSEHTIRMKKTLGTLNTRSLKSSEPLRIGLADIRDSDRKGKWWLIGASWAGKEPTHDEMSDKPTSRARHCVADDIVADTGTTDLAQLAREQRMNTDVRRAIFIAIMSASDFQDAYMRLNKLKLKKTQEHEIPKVLMHCSGAELSYNPYYTLIAKKLCGERKLKMAFQFSLWDLFRKMGEGDNDSEVLDGDNGDTLTTRNIVNLAKMFGSLIVDGGLSISILKNINLTCLQPITQTFVEVLLITIFLQPQRQPTTANNKTAITSLIASVKEFPSMVSGLQYFIQKVVSKADIAGGKDEKLRIKQACKITIETLRALATEDAI